MAVPAAPATLACIGACIAQMMTPASRDDLAQRIKAQGPAQAVAYLSQGGLQSGTRWDAVMIAIESGDAGWLAIAADLRKGADAATGEALLGSISTALRRNAPAVLGMIGPDLPADAICFPRMIEPRPIDVKVFEVHTENALKGVTDPRLRTVRDRCLAILRAHTEDQ